MSESDNKKIKYYNKVVKPTEGSKITQKFFKTNLKKFF